MNKGILSGDRSVQWLSYTPEIHAVNYSGNTATDISLGNGTSVGKYFRTPAGLVVVQGIITFGSSTTFGSGEDFWVISLPVQVNRSSGGADMPIGVAWGWQGSSANPQVNSPLTPTVADAAYPATSSQEDSYIQLFCHWGLSYGTGSIASASTSTTINHLMPFTPMASDIHVVSTANTTNNAGQLYINNIGATSFQVNCRSAPGASTLAFSWKVRGEPVGPSASASTGGLLASAKAPWTWASGHVISFQVQYEARR